MLEDFYFAYGHNSESNKISRLYRRINNEFERYNTVTRSWEPAPEQCCIYIGEDWDYEEITEKEAFKIIDNDRVLI